MDFGCLPGISDFVFSSSCVGRDGHELEEPADCDEGKRQPGPSVDALDWVKLPGGKHLQKTWHRHHILFYT